MVLFILGAAIASAQPMHEMRGSQKVMEMIRTLRMMRMREHLGLTDEQVASLLPGLSRRDSLVLAHRKAQAEDFKLLKEELAKRNPTESRLTQIMNRLKKREDEYHGQMMKIRDEMLLVLSVEQQAKFVIFEVEFEREIRGYIERIKKGHGMGER